MLENGVALEALHRAQREFHAACPTREPRSGSPFVLLRCIVSCAYARLHAHLHARPPVRMHKPTHARKNPHTHARSHIHTYNLSLSLSGTQKHIQTRAQKHTYMHTTSMYPGPRWQKLPQHALQREKQGRYTCITRMPTSSRGGEHARSPPAERVWHAIYLIVIHACSPIAGCRTWHGMSKGDGHGTRN